MGRVGVTLSGGSQGLMAVPGHTRHSSPPSSKPEIVWEQIAGVPGAPFPKTEAALAVLQLLFGGRLGLCGICRLLPW